jgi:hypothetical protein
MPLLQGLIRLSRVLAGGEKVLMMRFWHKKKPGSGLPGRGFGNKKGYIH